MITHITGYEITVSLFFCNGIFSCCKPCFAQLNPKIVPVLTQFGARLVNNVQTDGLHGSISAAVIKDGRIIWSGAFGNADHYRNDAIADTGTIYRIGSITKVFTATLLMQMVEEGKIKLDDPVENIVPEIKNIHGYNENNKITFRELALHTSGLKREPDMDRSNVGPTSQWEKIIGLYSQYLICK